MRVWPLCSNMLTSRLRDEFLNGEIFYSLREAQIESWRHRELAPTLQRGASGRLSAIQAARAGGPRAPWSGPAGHAGRAPRFT